MGLVGELSGDEDAALEEDTITPDIRVLFSGEPLCRAVVIVAGVGFIGGLPANDAFEVFALL